MHGPTPSVLTLAEEVEQARILREGTGLDAYFFAQNPGADIQALQEVILARGKGWTVQAFAHDIPGADIQVLQEVALVRGDAMDAFLFARDIPQADILACARRIVALDHQDEKGLLRRLQEIHPEALIPEVLAELSLGVTL